MNEQTAQWIDVGIWAALGCVIGVTKHFLQAK